MDLYSIAAGPVATVNPMQPATIFGSAGSFTTEDGDRHPIYATAYTIEAQVQQLSMRDIMQLQEMNISGSERKIYAQGEIVGLSRVRQLGGDIIHLQDGTDWLVTAVLEQWPDWVCVSVTEQLPEEN